ncbi:MAG: type II secretion system protein [Chlamydiia bacterium]|nr:type II secretion system protein [Chlamydiia bacterium]
MRRHGTLFSAENGIRRRYFTLIEMLIAMGLIAILLTALMGIYRELTFVQSDLTENRQKIFQIVHLQKRLQDALTHALSFGKNKKKNVYFYTSNREDPSGFPRLIFTYDNGIDLNPLFSGNVIGAILLEKSDRGRLLLRRWPLKSCIPNQTPPIQDEILLDGVEAINFSFFYPRNPLEEVTNQNQSSQDVISIPADTWFTSWDYSYKRLPAVVKIELTLDEKAKKLLNRDKIELAFFLGGSNLPILIP